MKYNVKTISICICTVLLLFVCIAKADTESSDLHNAFGYVDGDYYRNPFLGIEILWPEAEYKLPPSSSVDTIIANFENSSDGMVLMMLKDSDEDELSLKLYRSTEEEKIEPAILDRDDDYQAMLLDKLLRTLNEDEKNLPVLPGKLQTIDISGRKAYWIPVNYNFWDKQLYTINIQIDLADYSLLITASSYQPLTLEDVLSTICLADY
ncbi:MAG: hypothetical protein IKG87_13970 [Clostridia bacterium]|nr:hypothetical protein [Clostridia bacterium]